MSTTWFLLNNDKLASYLQEDVEYSSTHRGLHAIVKKKEKRGSQPQQQQQIVPF